MKRTFIGRSGAGATLVLSVIAIGLASAVGLAVEPYVTTADVVMIFLLAVIVVAFRTSIVPALGVVLLAIATFDFLFVTPRMTFSVQDMRFIFTFGVMALVGISVAALSDRVRRQSHQLAALGVEREKERMHAALLSSISHDLRTPLGVILSAATTLLDADTTLPADRRDELLRTIESQSINLGRLLRNLLEMTRFDGMFRFHDLEPHAVEEVVETAVRGLSKDAYDRIATIRTPEVFAFARMDPLAIEIVLSNLLENAAKYSGNDSPIEIRVELDETSDNIVVEVEDRGPGVAADQRERIFDKFVRGVHPSVHGAGLGLAIARAIVEAHGGRICCRDTVSGVGAVFAFTLPCADNLALGEEVVDA